MTVNRKKHVKSLSIEKKYAKHGWVFVSPFLFGLVFIFIEVVLNSLRFSFGEITAGISGYLFAFKGVENYQHVLFVDANFNRILVNSAVKMLYDVPLVIIFSLFIATILNKKILGRGIFRTIFFIPAVLITGVIAQSGYDNVLLQSMSSLQGIQTGGTGAGGFMALDDIQKLLGGAVLNDGLSSYIFAVVNNIFSVVNLCGVQILIFIAGLQSISPSIYESAEIEGASGWDCYWKITFPMISPMIFVNLIYTIIESFVNPSNQVMATIYNLGIRQSKLGIASAMSWIYFLIIGLFLVIASVVMNRVTFYQSK